ncbi:MAG: hypothetical protein WBQ73_03700 [Candidatus Babeliales bacterium]
MKYSVRLSVLICLGMYQLMVQPSCGSSQQVVPFPHSIVSTLQQPLQSFNDLSLPSKIVVGAVALNGIRFVWQLKNMRDRHTKCVKQDSGNVLSESVPDSSQYTSWFPAPINVLFETVTMPGTMAANVIGGRCFDVNQNEKKNTCDDGLIYSTKDKSNDEASGLCEFCDGKKAKPDLENDYSKLKESCQKDIKQREGIIRKILSMDYPSLELINSSFDETYKKLQGKVKNFEEKHGKRCRCHKKHIPFNCIGPEVLGRHNYRSLLNTYQEEWNCRLYSASDQFIKKLLDKNLKNVIERGIINNEYYNDVITGLNSDMILDKFSEHFFNENYCKNEIFSLIKQYRWHEDLRLLSSACSDNCYEDLLPLSRWWISSINYNEDLWRRTRKYMNYTLFKYSAPIYTEAIGCKINEFKAWCKDKANDKTEHEMYQGLTTIKNIFGGIKAQTYNAKRRVREYYNTNDDTYYYPSIVIPGIKVSDIFNKYTHPQNKVYVEWLMSDPNDPGFLEWYERMLDKKENNEADRRDWFKVMEEYEKKINAQSVIIEKEVNRFVSTKEQKIKALVDHMVPDNAFDLSLTPKDINNNRAILDQLEKLVCDEEYDDVMPTKVILVRYIEELDSGTPEIVPIIFSYLYPEIVETIAFKEKKIKNLEYNFDCDLAGWKSTKDFKALNREDMRLHLEKKRAFLKPKEDFLVDTENMEVYSLKEFLAWCNKENYCSDYRMVALIYIEEQLKKQRRKQLKRLVKLFPHDEENEKKADSALKDNINQNFNLPSEDIGIYANWISNNQERDFISNCGNFSSCKSKVKGIPPSLFRIFFECRHDFFEQTRKAVRKEQKKVLEEKIRENGFQ